MKLKVELVLVAILRLIYIIYRCKRSDIVSYINYPQMTQMDTDERSDPKSLRFFIGVHLRHLWINVFFFVIRKLIPSPASICVIYG